MFEPLHPREQGIDWYSIHNVSIRKFKMAVNGGKKVFTDKHAVTNMLKQNCSRKVRNEK